MSMVNSINSKNHRGICNVGINANVTFRTNVVTTIAYLIGVSDEQLQNCNNFLDEEVEKLRTNENATVIRHLCIVRNNILKSFYSIDNMLKDNVQRKDWNEELFGIESIKYLREKNFLILENYSERPCSEFFIAYINQYLLEKIDSVKECIPSWVEFNYVKDLFLISGGYAGNRGSALKKNTRNIYSTIKKAFDRYIKEKRYYPYQQYVSWHSSLIAEGGNILSNDFKFLTSLYKTCGDRFTAIDKVRDAAESIKERIYDFIEEANKVVAVIDCENVDPYKFVSVILNLKEKTLRKIRVIKCYTDNNATWVWRHISKKIKIPVEIEIVERIKEDKSLVDQKMMGGIYKAFYQEGFDAVILVSSDSDFYSVISDMFKDGLKFFVLNEEEKTAQALVNKLDENKIQHCCIDIFGQDVVQSFKMEMVSEAVDYIIENKVNCDFGLTYLINRAFRSARVEGEDGQLIKEKKAFYDKYIRGKVTFDYCEETGGLLLKRINKFIVGAK